MVQTDVEGGLVGSMSLLNQIKERQELVELQSQKLEQSGKIRE